MDALRQNDFEAYKELLRQTHGPQTDEDRFKGTLQLTAHVLSAAVQVGSHSAFILSAVPRVQEFCMQCLA
jgi:hypothetical protein